MAWLGLARGELRVEKEKVTIDPKNLSIKGARGQLYYKWSRIIQGSQPSPRLWEPSILRWMVLLRPVRLLKFRYSEKATTFEKNLPLYLILLGNIKKVGRYFLNFVAFSQYLNFTPPKYICQNAVWQKKGIDNVADSTIRLHTQIAC